MSDLVKKILVVIGVAVAVILVIAALSSVTGCVSAPDKDDYVKRPDACYDFAVCMYYNSKNPDKSICTDSAKECRAYGRYSFCRDAKNLPEGSNFQSCWDKLNAK